MAHEVSYYKVFYFYIKLDCCCWNDMIQQRTCIKFFEINWNCSEVRAGRVGLFNKLTAMESGFLGVIGLGNRSELNIFSSACILFIETFQGWIMGSAYLLLFDHMLNN